MKAAVLDSFGSPLAVREVDDPTLRAGEVIVDVAATGVLSYMDEVVSGQRQYTLELPATPGAGCVGRVREIGADATRLKVGDWVHCDPTIRSRDNPLNPDITLQGLSARGPGGMKLQKAFPDGAWAERMRIPTENATPLGDDVDPVKWAAVLSLLVPFGGLLKAELQAGETVVVSGATGGFGAAAVALALGLGAGCVVATGRNTDALAELARRFGPRVRTVRMEGDEQGDRERIQAAASGPIDLVADLLPPQATAVQARAALMAVRPYGRVVLMGGVNMQGGPGLELPYAWIMRQCVTIHGSWMYAADAPGRLVRLIRAGLVDLDLYQTTTFPLGEVNEAIAHAAATAAPFRKTVLVAQ